MTICHRESLLLRLARWDESRAPSGWTLTLQLFLSEDLNGSSAHCEFLFIIGNVAIHASVMMFHLFEMSLAVIPEQVRSPEGAFSCCRVRED